MVDLRPYQARACERIRQALIRHRSTLLVLPTGTGKTVVFCHIIRDQAASGHRALILAHRDELLKQATAKLATVGIRDVGLEKGLCRAGDQPVVVASVQSLRGERLRRIPRNAFPAQCESNPFVGVIYHTSGSPTVIHVLSADGPNVQAMVWTSREGWAKAQLQTRDLIGSMKGGQFDGCNHPPQPELW